MNCGKYNLDENDVMFGILIVFVTLIFIVIEIVFI